MGHRKIFKATVESAYGNKKPLEATVMSIEINCLQLLSVVMISLIPLHEISKSVPMSQES